MLVESFRLVTARLIPLVLRYKQALLLGTVILAGCGGSGAAKTQSDWQTVARPGFSFSAPAGWKVERAPRRVSVTSGSELVQVSTFPLLKPYDEKLFGRVAVELRSRMQDIARQTGGKVTGERTVTTDGVRSHSYDITDGNRVDEYTFVLNDMHEHLLLCRRSSTEDSGFCAQLITSFARR
jgi:hypothetical protein